MSEVASDATESNGSCCKTKFEYFLVNMIDPAPLEELD